MAPKQIPVRIPQDREYVYRYRAKHDWTDPPPTLRHLDPDTQVIVVKAPDDERMGRYHSSYRHRIRTDFPEDLSQIVIRAPRKRFRKGKTFEARWKRGLMTTKWVTEGKNDPRCPRCSRHRRIKRMGVGLIGCPNHVKWVLVDVPDPRAGAILGTFSTVKLYGLSEGTDVLFPDGAGWAWGTVHDCDLWRERKRLDAKAQRKRANELRRFMRRPTRWDRVLQD